MKYLLVLAFSFSLFATEKVESTPKLKGIVLLNGYDPLLDAKTLEGIEGILASSFVIPGNECELNLELEKLLNEPFNDATLTEIQDKIYEYYRASDRPFVLVEVPEQKEKTGVAQIIVQESTLGKLSVVGNKWTSSKRYENYFRLKPGDPISQHNLNRSVDFMNRNPYRFVNVIYSPGEKEYTTDLTLEVADRKPYFFYAGLDNTGVPTTGRARVFAGFSWDQMFSLDQTFFYQYSTNYSSQNYHSNSFQYTAMLPWEAILLLYGGFSITHAQVPIPNATDNKGTSIQGSIRYVLPIRPKAHYAQELVFGFDLKHTNNTIEFTDIDPIIGNPVNISEWTLGYKCKYEWKKVEVEGGLEAVFSPFQWLSDQTEEDFESLRPDATNTWFYATGYCNIHRTLPYYFSTHLRFNGQYSMSTLLPSEQIGVGGFASVRGYDERQTNGDTGFVWSWEVHTPHFPLFRTKTRSLNNDAYFLLFTDGGFTVDNHVVPGIPRSDFLASIGAGFRYYLNTYLSARVDWGMKLHHQTDFTSGWQHVHFSVSGSY
jgi:hemolysin activation/secretion protein